MSARAAAGALLLAATFMAGCGEARECGPTGDPTAVRLCASWFDPDSLRVLSGVPVEWRNDGGDAVHRLVVATASGELLAESEDLGRGARFSFAFPEAGDYEVHCVYHSSGTTGARDGMVMAVQALPRSNLTGGGPAL